MARPVVQDGPFRLQAVTDFHYWERPSLQHRGRCVYRVRLGTDALKGLHESPDAERGNESIGCRRIGHPGHVGRSLGGAEEPVRRAFTIKVINAQCGVLQLDGAVTRPAGTKARQVISEGRRNEFLMPVFIG